MLKHGSLVLKKVQNLNNPQIYSTNRVKKVPVLCEKKKKNLLLQKHTQNLNITFKFKAQTVLKRHRSGAVPFCVTIYISVLSVPKDYTSIRQLKSRQISHFYHVKPSK